MPASKRKPGIVTTLVRGTQGRYWIYSLSARQWSTTGSIRLKPGESRRVRLTVKCEEVKRGK